MHDPWPTISIEPLDAGLRQLDASIRLLFAYEDPLAVHTLAYAAYGLLKNESKTRGTGKTLAQLDSDSKNFPQGEFWKRFSDLGNALKHPDRTAKDVPEEFNEALLVICCLLVREFQPLLSPESISLWLWYHAQFFINIDDAPDQYWNWIGSNWQQLHAETRIEKLEIGADLLREISSVKQGIHTMNPEHELLPWRTTMQPSGPPEK